MSFRTCTLRYYSGPVESDRTANTAVSVVRAFGFCFAAQLQEYFQVNIQCAHLSRTPMLCVLSFSALSRSFCLFARSPLFRSSRVALFVVHEAVYNKQYATCTKVSTFRFTNNQFLFNSCCRPETCRSHPQSPIFPTASDELFHQPYQVIRGCSQGRPLICVYTFIRTATRTSSFTPSCATCFDGRRGKG